MKVKVKRLHHIQICIPIGAEDEARDFYCRILGWKEIEKPAALKANGGFWLELGDVQVHIGTEAVANQSKRHPAFEIEDLEATKEYLQEQGVQVKEATEIPDWQRYYIYDPFSNRIEFLATPTRR